MSGPDSDGMGMAGGSYVPTDRVGEGQAGPSAPTPETLAKADKTVAEFELRFPPGFMRTRFTTAERDALVYLIADDTSRASRASEAALAEARREAQWQEERAVTAESSLATMTKERDDFRKALWLGHGHMGVYGDDGEMQCGAVGQHGEVPGPIDFKRDEPFRVCRAALSASRAEATKAERERCVAIAVDFVSFGYREAMAAAIRAPRPPEPRGETSLVSNQVKPPSRSAPTIPEDERASGRSGSDSSGVTPGHDGSPVAPSSPPPPSEEPRPRCGRCELHKIGLPTPGYPHAADCPSARLQASSPTPPSEEPKPRRNLDAPDPPPMCWCPEPCEVHPHDPDQCPNCFPSPEPTREEPR